MTDYEGMKPSEINAMVAERVMGWRRCDNGDWLNGLIRVRGLSWFPSTSIADAWEVVERMFEGGACVAIGQRDDGSCGVSFYRRADDDRLGEGNGKAPLAICIAALRAHDE